MWSHRAAPHPARFVLPGFFLVCAAPVLLFIALYVPTGESPDEVAHVIRMESVLHHELVGRRWTRTDEAGQVIAESGVLANPALLSAGFSFPPGTPLQERRMTPAREQELRRFVWAPRATRLSVPNTAVYAPLLYLPGAMGMQVAKWRGLQPWDAIRSARLANALAFLVLGTAALLAARRLRGALLAVLLLPMTLWLAATCSQDGMAIGLAALGVALLTRGSVPAWWGSVACVAALCVAKPPYLPLVGVLAAFLPVRGWAWRLRGAGVACAAVPGLAWYVFAQARAGVPFVRGAPAPAGPFWYGAPGQMFGIVDPALQLRVLLHEPSLVLRLPWGLFRDQGGWLYWEALGLLGTLDLLMPLWLYTLWGVALGALLVGEAMAGPRAAGGPGAWRSLVVPGCVGAAALALCIAQYISWTMTGAAGIEGVQGRYFIPLAAFLALALPAVRVRGGSALRWGLRAPLAAAGLAGLALLPGVVLSTYYLR